jgi:hypothetical protein
MPDPLNSENDENNTLKKESIGSQTDLGYKIGRFQQGSGIILEASINNTTTNPIQLRFTVTGTGANSVYNQVFTSPDFITGIGQVTLPSNLPA